MTETKVVRQARLLLQVPADDRPYPPDGGPFGPMRMLRPAELIEALTRLAAALPADARLEGAVLDTRAGPVGNALVFSWEEDLPPAGGSE